MRIFLLSLTLLAVLTGAVDAAVKNVFFAGGQSNAKSQWADAIEAQLSSDPTYDNVVMVHMIHSGNPLSNWYTTTPQANYQADLYKGDGTAALESALDSITGAGDTYRLSGFFWFQGESDSGSATSRAEYDNRFRAMLGQLKSDLSLSYDIDYTLAVIDADAGHTPSGRTYADVDALRNNQINMAATDTHGNYHDTRGFDRGDTWHVTTSGALQSLGTAMANSHVDAFGAGTSPPVELRLNSHSNDGAIYKKTNGATGRFTTTDLITGVGGDAAGGQQHNGILFFQLPDLSAVGKENLQSAALELTVQIGGNFDVANIDVWGLGYLNTSGNTLPTSDPAWILLADNEMRDGDTLGTNIGSERPTKIIDDLIAATTSANVGDVLVTNAAQGQVLLAHVLSLYEDHGAEAGDYAVFRINPDADVVATGGGTIRFGGSHRTDPDRRALLTLSTEAAVPEPSTFILFVLGLMGLVLRCHRPRKSAAAMHFERTPSLE